MTPLYRIHPAFEPHPAPLLDAVLTQVSWTDQMRSRRTASMGIPYNYAGASYPEAAWHPLVWAVAERIDRTLGFRPTNCLLNHYPTGEHTIGWHADDVTILAPGTGIAILSLGGERTLRLRKTLDEGFAYTDLVLENGSLLSMTAALQADHKHAIKREPGAQSRVSLTFRHLTHAPPPVDRPRWSER